MTIPWVSLAAITSFCVVSGLTLYLWRTGAFASATVQEGTVGPFIGIYQNYVGLYPKVGPTFGKVFSVIKAHNKSLMSNQCFGVFFDSPKEVSPDKCRASVGVIAQSSSVEPSSEEIEQMALANNDWLKANNLEVALFPASRFLFCEMPFNNGLQMMAGIQRAYAKLGAALPTVSSNQDEKRKVYGSLELYDDANHTMRIGFVLSKREVLLPFPLPTGAATVEESAAA